MKDAAILRKELQTMSIGTYNQIMTQFSFPANGRLWMRMSVAAYNHFEEYEIFRDAINEIVLAANTYKKSLGIMVNNKQELETYYKLGFNMIAVGTEMNILSRSISQILK